jgi:hypothetical protein
LALGEDPSGELLLEGGAAHEAPALKGRYPSRVPNESSGLTERRRRARVAGAPTRLSA